MGVGRVVGVLVGTVAILGIGVYGPATLLGPLPMATIGIPKDSPVESTAVPPALPDAGASAVTESAGSSPLATAGDEAPLPIAAIAKTITALVVLDKHPMTAETDGETVPISEEDFLSYNDYRAAGIRTVTVYTADSWTQRGMLQAMLLGSSNNHADTLARWGFGSVDSYIEAASTWLTDNGLKNTTVVDATGLSEKSISTASDLARLAAIAANDPVITSVLSEPVDGIASVRGVTNTTEYLPELGVTGISRSYTDKAGICFLFSATITDGDDSYTFYGAMIRLPDWETLESGVKALMASAQAGVTKKPLVAEGAAVATVSTAWGKTALGLAGKSPLRMRWEAAPVKYTLQIDEFSTGADGQVIGTITVEDDGKDVKIPVKLDRTIMEPDALWRLSHPIPLIPDFITSLTKGN